MNIITLKTGGESTAQNRLWKKKASREQKNLYAGYGKRRRPHLFWTAGQSHAKHSKL
jgi:hypothetical protein